MLSRYKKIIGSVDSAQSVIPVDTNGQGQQAFLLCGDSISQGSNNGGGPGPTPTAGTAYYWDYSNSTVTQITNADIIGASNGSIAPQFCIDYNASNGNKAVIIPAGVSGSRFWSPTGSGSWFTDGTLYSTAKTRATACMAAIGVNTLKGIILILGVNDINSSDALGSITPAIDSLFQRFMSDYPGVPIYAVMPGRTSSTENMNNRFALIRNQIRANMETYPNVHLAAYLSPFVNRGLIGADNLHPTQTGNNTIGSTINTYIQNISYSKWTRSVLSLFETNLSGTKKTAIQTFLNAQIANGNWAKLDTAQVFRSESQNDALTDWRYFSCTKLNTGLWASKSGLSSDGAATYIRPEFIPSLQLVKGSVNDVFCKIYIINNQTPSNTQGNAFGGVNSTQQMGIFQNTSASVTYRMHDGGGQTIGDTAILNNTLYTVSRVNSTTKRILKNGVQVISVTQSATAVLARELYIGALNNGGVAASFLNSSYAGFFIGQESGFDHASFDSDFATLLTALAV